MKHKEGDEKTELAILINNIPDLDGPIEFYGIVEHDGSDELILPGVNGEQRKFINTGIYYRFGNTKVWLFDLL